MLDLGFALFLALISAGLGKRLLAARNGLPEHPLDALALAAPLGLGLVSLAVLAVGELGWLNLLGLGVLLAVATELGLVTGLRLVRDWIRGLVHSDSGEVKENLDHLLWLLGVVTAAATAMAALVPVTDGDALCYHLQVPKVFLVERAVGFDPDLHETVYPLLTEMIYALALEFRGPVACRGLQWILGLLFAANVTALARPSMGARAWWAGLVALLVPAVTGGMSAPLNDVSLACFGMASLHAAMRALDRRTMAATLWAGVFAGLALGVKYPALVLCSLLTAVFAARPLLARESIERKRVLQGLGLAACFALMAMAVGGAWYLRAYVHTGNPVYPFFRNWFGGAGLEEVLAPIKRPLPVGLWNLITALVPLTLEPHRFDSFAHQFGPIFLLFLPALLLERAPRRVLGLVLLGYLFLMLCLTQRQSMRFLLVGVGPMAIGVAYLGVIWRQRSTIPARVLLTLLLGVLGIESCLSVARAARGAGVVLGRETVHDFLARCEPTYRVGNWVAKHLPATARMVGQDHRGFYIPRNYTMELAHRRRTGLGTNGESGREVVAALRHAGFTHLMLCPPIPETAVEFDPTMGKLLEPWLAARAPVYLEELSDADGVLRRYSIYELPEDRVSSIEATERTR